VQLVLVTLPDRYERQVVEVLVPLSEHEVMVTLPDLRVVHEVPAWALAMTTITSIAALTNRMVCFLG